MSGYFSLIKPHYGLVSVLFVWIGFLLAGSDFFVRDMIFSFLSIFLITSGAMALNDIVDREIDSHNKPKRPIPSGKLSLKKAKIFSSVLFILGNFFGIILGSREFYFLLLTSIILIAYELKLKKILILNHIILSFLFVTPFIFGSYVFGSIESSVWIATVLFFAFLGKELYKIIENMLGEKRAVEDNIAMRIGVIKTKMIAAIITLISVIASFLPFVFGVETEIYLFFAILADILLISSIASPARYSNIFSKTGIALMIFAFFLGTEQIYSIII